MVALCRRLAAAWKEAEQLRAELQEEAFSRKNIMDDIRIKQQTIAEQEAIIADHVAFRHRHQQQMDDLKQKIQVTLVMELLVGLTPQMQRYCPVALPLILWETMQEADKMKEDLEGERLETRGQIDQLRAEVDAVEERLATKRMKKRAYKRNMLQLQIEHENVKRAYMHHDQDRERERERMHDIENQLSDKIQECTEKETSMYVLAHGVSSTVPLVWKLEAAIAYLRKELAASRAGVASLTAVVAERDEQILTKAKEIMGLFRQIRGLESVVEELRDRTRELEVQLDDTKVWSGSCLRSLHRCWRWPGTWR